MSELAFWKDNAHKWIKLIHNSLKFIEADIDCAHVHNALVELDVMRDKIAHLSEAIKEIRNLQ